MKIWRAYRGLSVSNQAMLAMMAFISILTLPIVIAYVPEVWSSNVVYLPGDPRTEQEYKQEMGMLALFHLVIVQWILLGLFVFKTLEERDRT